MEAVDSVYEALSLNTPVSRLLATSAATGALMYYFRPNLFFDSLGEPRPWNVISESEESTMVPWWFVSVGIGVISATFF